MLLVFILLIFFITILTTRFKFFIQINDNSSTNIYRLKIYLFSYVPVISLNINKINNKLESKYKNKIKNRVKIDRIFGIIQQIRKNKSFKLEELKLKVKISTSDAVLTSCSVAIVATLISGLLKISNFEINNKKLFYEIKPVYEDKIFASVKLKTVFSITLLNVLRIASVN